MSLSPHFPIDWTQWYDIILLHSLASFHDLMSVWDGFFNVNFIVGGGGGRLMICIRNITYVQGFMVFTYSSWFQFGCHSFKICNPFSLFCMDNHSFHIINANETRLWTVPLEKLLNIVLIASLLNISVILFNSFDNLPIQGNKW